MTTKVKEGLLTTFAVIIIIAFCVFVLSQL
jgi:hypothetical protein